LLSRGLQVDLTMAMWFRILPIDGAVALGFSVETVRANMWIYLEFVAVEHAEIVCPTLEGNMYPTLEG